MVQLYGVNDFSKDNFTKMVEENLLDFFRWGFLEANAFTQVPVTTPGTPDPYADETLFVAHKDSVADGTVWQAKHTDWVYESGMVNVSPPQIAQGVYINGTYYPTSSTTGTYAHYIDFPHGRIVFSSAIPTTSIVQCAYTYRWVSFYDESTSWFRAIALNQTLTEESNMTATAIQLLSDYRVECPLVILEMVPKRTLKPYMLGGYTNWVDQDVLFHVVAESKEERDNIVDAITLQKEHSISLYDSNARTTANSFPLDWRGMLVASPVFYPTLIEVEPTGYLWSQGYFSAMSPSEVSKQLPFFRAVVRATFTVVFNGVP